MTVFIFCLEFDLKRIFLLFFCVTSQAIAAVYSPEEISTLKQHFFNNFQQNGAIVASPSRENPNYYYDWVRDSAIAMSLIESWYESTQASEYKNRLYQYVSWTKKIQTQLDPLPEQDILGEPKFYIDGLPFSGPWGRPQNDGPAIRASVLIHFAQRLIDNNEQDYVRSNLYDNSLDDNKMGVIKKDLEYIAHHWMDANFDLWEEILGHHFFTARAQQKALSDGAKLARRLNDTEAAVFYSTQAHLIANHLTAYLDPDNTLIQATLPPHPGPQKTLELDSAVLLGILINPDDKGVFSPFNSYVKNTLDHLHQQFNFMFPLNENVEGAILFGRYPGDTYDGYQTQSLGNPWFILTATVAEYYYTLADMLPLTKQHKPQVLKYIRIGDSYLKLIKKYAPDLYLSEQINLNTGKQQGANSLTWSYVAVLKAIDLREKLESKLITG